jgi:hypothetical protein
MLDINSVQQHAPAQTIQVSKETYDGGKRDLLYADF